MKIAVDLDGVIVDLVGAWHRWCYDYCPGHWLYSDKLPCDIRETAEFDVAKWTPCGQYAYGFFDTNPHEYAQPIAGAVAGLKALVEEGHTVRIVSAISVRHPEHYEYKVDWIRRWLGDDWLSRFIAVIGSKDDIDADMLIDDNPKNIEAWLGPYTVTFKQPWNQSWLMSFPKYMRGWYWADNWAEVLKLFREGYWFEA